MSEKTNTQRVVEAIKAVLRGKVATYGQLAAVGVQRWGAFDPASVNAVEHEARQAGDADLLDAAAIFRYL